MIGRISGILLERHPAGLLVDVQGLGYEVKVPLSTLFALPIVGERVTLHTHLASREDGQTLYGFLTLADRELFRELIKVTGVGPKLALTILSCVSAEQFVRAVRAQDGSALVRLPGIGKRTAERLLLELRDRLDDWQVAGAGSGPSDAGTRSPVVEVSPMQEAEQALVALGYKPQEAARAVSRAQQEGDEPSTSEALIRRALRSMVGG